MADLPTPDDVRRYGALLHRAAHEGNDGGCYPQSCRQFDRYAEVLLTGLAQDGRLLPPETTLRRESEPGGRGEARVIRRTHHVTPWQEVAEP